MAAVGHPEPLLERFSMVRRNITKAKQVTYQLD